MLIRIIPFIFIFFVLNLSAQDSLSLYTKIPNSRPTTDTEISDWGEDGILRVSNVSEPMLYIFQPGLEQKPNGTAIIICPGGGYGILAMSHEGFDVAKKLNEWGITAFVLKYRLPDDKRMIYKSIGPLQDAQRAMQLVREKSGEWKIDKDKIGIMGFSAGGHLAATLSTQYEPAIIDNNKNTSLRPDFSILIYPVISFTDSLTHAGSRENLLGKNSDEKQIESFSAEKQVNANTPPAFLVHAKDDMAVSVANSREYELALVKYKIPVTTHFYKTGGHGFGMNNKSESKNWMDWLKEWLIAQNFL